MTDATPVEFGSLREEMVNQVIFYTSKIAPETGHPEISDRVLDVMRHVPRHEFVPANVQTLAYVDSPLPIGRGKSISQPSIVALMTDLLEIEPTDQVLEIGTGLGYQAAILAALGDTVYTVEIVEELAREAERSLTEQGLDNIHMGIGDGSIGWPENAPFDKILVAAAPELIPTSLLHQLKPGGKMVVPAGIEDAQQLILVDKDLDGRLRTQERLHVRFSALEVAQ
jgi:protein-L-isoaspartate(D-aspartate) O-methyltransferase